MKKFLFALGLVSSVMASLMVAGRALAGSETDGPSGSNSGAAAVSACSDNGIAQATAQDAVAVGEQSPVQPCDGYKAGLWREGQAVFSDIMFLDFLMKDSDRRGFRPKQPINFSHATHVEKNQMECQYCHSGVAKSPFATLPSVELCMGCHKSVMTDKPEIKKLAKYYEDKQPIPWVHVHNLPEHAHFNHKRHLKAGVGCQNCHGQIPKMPVVEKVSSMKMGFCVSCHRENGASIDCSTCHY